MTSPLPASAAPSPPAGLRITDSPGRGRGVVAERAFRCGEVLERAPVLVLERTTMASRATPLDDYVFWWDDDHLAVAFGWVSLCNHTCPANARFRVDRTARVLVLEAAADLAVGEEVTINYHGEPSDPAPVWFPVH